jgi:tetratricopeptide (TPR) repeat protein
MGSGAVERDVNERLLLIAAGVALAVLLVIGVISALRARRAPRRRGGRRSVRERRHDNAASPALPAPAFPPPAASPALPSRMFPPPPALRSGVSPARVDGPPASESVDPRSPLDQCLALYGEQLYADAVMLATSVLAREGGAGDAHETAALWSVTALARAALGDDDGARAAFDSAIAAAPPTERPVYQRHLAGLALATATRLLARADGSGDIGGEEQALAFRQAVAWCTVGLAAVPGDEALATTLATARDGMWPTTERLARMLMHRGDFARARRMVRDALADAALPEWRRDAFESLLAATFSGEVGRLTAEAIRSVRAQTDTEVVVGLERAEAMLTVIPGGSLTPARRAEVTRRLGWGYTALGMRRLEGGEHERAVDPLLRAIGFEGADPERLEETHAALARALTGATDARLLNIEALIRAGDPDAASREAQALQEFLEACASRGARSDLVEPLLARARGVA